MKTIRMYVTNYTTLTGIHDGTRAIMSTNDGGGSSTDIIRRRASSPTQSKSPKFEHRGARNDERRLTPLKRRPDASGSSRRSVEDGLGAG